MSAKVLLLDIETAPILGYSWGIWQQNIGLSQIKDDWAIIAWSAKWLGDPAKKILYEDQRAVKNVRDDKKLLKGIWKLIDEADIVVTQNGKAFDIKKLNARFIMNGMDKPAPFQHIDTKKIASRVFGFTSNKLEYMTDKLCKKFKKSKHASFSGFDLWKECLNGNLKAWKEMEHYNKLDVLSLEELYLKLRPWCNDNVNMAVYQEGVACTHCGHKKLTKNGFKFTTGGKYQRYQCHNCGAYMRGNKNLLPRARA
jgi:hypothetical protein